MNKNLVLLGNWVNIYARLAFVLFYLLIFLFAKQNEGEFGKRIIY